MESGRGCNIGVARCLSPACPGQLRAYFAVHHRQWARSFGSWFRRANPGPDFLSGEHSIVSIGLSCLAHGSASTGSKQFGAHN